MIVFDNIYYLLLLLLIPILVLAQKKYVLWQKTTQNNFGTPSALKKLTNNNNKKYQISFLLKILVLVFIILALSNPKFGEKLEKVNTKGVEVVFVLDVSKSMLCNDVAPNRLAQAKQIITQTIDQLKSDRVGMIAYASSAYPVLPMTTDYGLAKMHTNTLSTDIISSQGTDIQTALEKSVAFFDNPNSGKAIILLTDGEDHESGKVDIKSIVKSKNIKIIPVGIGTVSGGNIIFTDEYGVDQIKKDENNNVVVTKLQTQFLEQIANDSKTKLVLNQSLSDKVSNITNQLNKVEKQEYKAQQFAQRKSQFQWFIGLALLVLTVNFMYQNNFFKVLKNLKFVCLFFTIPFYGQQNTIQEKNFRENIANKTVVAKQSNYNIGNKIYQFKKPKEAVLFYKNYQKLAKNNKEKHIVNHNLGNAYMQQKKYKEAVNAYKDALRANPKDEQTRYNFALAKKMLEKNPPKPKKNNKPKDNKKQQPNNKPKPNPAKDRMDNVLQAINEQEKKVQEKANKNKDENKQKINAKDW
jgi:tetratricopeptide (TPR) repeat protein